MKKIKLLYFICFFIPCIAIGQSLQLEPLYNVPVFDSIMEKSFSSWTGGFNAVNINTADLNLDGHFDIVIYDLQFSNIFPFLNAGIPDSVNYIFSPEYKSNFPQVGDWMVLADLDQDGYSDMVTPASDNIMAASPVSLYKGNVLPDGSLGFTLFVDTILHLDGGELKPIMNPVATLPVIKDIDNDGDMDWLGIKPNGLPEKIYYYKNFSIETSGTPSGLDYVLEDDCFGNIKLVQSLAVELGGSACPGFQSGTSGLLHDRSHTLALYDWGSDGDLDLFTGHYLYPTINRLENEGNNNTFVFNMQDTVFSPQGLSFEVANYPAPSFIDLNNDGLEELIIAPNDIYDYYNKNQIKYCKNTGVPGADFLPLSRAVFADLSDVGEFSDIEFFDHNQDGLLDILVGGVEITNILVGNNLNPETKLLLFENIGSETAPEFQLIDTDYINYSDIPQEYGVYPVTIDLDGDGDKDLLTGGLDGQLKFFRNNAPLNQPADFELITESYQDIDVGNYGVPEVYDVNQDGLLDLILGNEQGFLHLYINEGTSSNPEFVLKNDFWGEVDVRLLGATTGYSIPHIYEEDGMMHLLVGSESGEIYHYTGIENNINGTFMSAAGSPNNFKIGTYSSVCSAKLFGEDKPRVFSFGGNRGGAFLFTQEDSMITNIKNIVQSIAVYPNPTNSQIVLEFENSTYPQGVIEISDVFGRKIFKNTIQTTAGTNMHTLNLSGSTGIYFVTLTIGGEQYVTKVLKK